MSGKELFWINFNTNLQSNDPQNKPSNLFTYFKAGLHYQSFCDVSLGANTVFGRTSKQSLSLKGVYTAEYLDQEEA